MIEEESFKNLLPRERLIFSFQCFHTSLSVPSLDRPVFPSSVPYQPIFALPRLSSFSFQCFHTSLSCFRTMTLFRESFSPWAQVKGTCFRFILDATSIYFLLAKWLLPINFTLIFDLCSFSQIVPLILLPTFLSCCNHVIVWAAKFIVQKAEGRIGIHREIT